MAAPQPPLTGKNTARTAWRPAVSLLLVFVSVVLLISTTAESRQEPTSTTSGQEGSELRAWRREGVFRPDRASELPPPAPKPNSNVPGGGGPPLG